MPPSATTAELDKLKSRIRALRAKTAQTLDKEPKWRRPGRELLSGAKRTW